MSNKNLSNLAASVRQRLLNLSRESGEPFELVLTRYANERLLYRLSKSSYAGKFVLKGAMLFLVWTDELHRPTRDVDLLGYGDSSEQAITEVFKGICQVHVEPDGLVFDEKSVTITDIRDEQEYGGWRAKFRAKLSKAVIPLQVDVGFGDAVSPGVKMVKLPTMLDFPAPCLRSYPMETVIAEKFQTMVRLGIANSRMNDFFDIWQMSKNYSFNGETLATAIKATFERRGTAVPSAVPMALTDEFATDAVKSDQWKAFIRRTKLAAGDIELTSIIGELSEFLMPIVLTISVGENADKVWSPGGPWSDKK